MHTSDRRLPEFPRGWRQVGQLDLADLCVGLALLVVVPFLVYFIAAFFVDDTSITPMGQKPKVDAPPDRQEVEMYLTDAEMMRENARRFLENMEATTDGALRDKYRQWTQRALEESLSKLDEVANFLIAKHPDGSAAFRTELTRIARLRQDAEADLARVRALDILGSN